MPTGPIDYRFTADGQEIRARATPRETLLTNAGAAAAEVIVAARPEALPAGRTRTFAHAGGGEGRDLRGVAFDLDGVIVTTDRLHYRAWKELADELGLDFDEQVNNQLRGVARSESLKRIYRHNDAPLPDEATFRAQCDRKNARYVELVGAMTPADVLPGSRELLKALREAGIAAALASASRNAPLVLERTGLAAAFDAVVDGSAATEAKPSPQGFLLAALRLGLSPWDCIGVEDAAAGIEAIRRAGMVALGVGPAAAGAHANVAGLHEVTVDSLRALFARTVKTRDAP